MEFRQIIEEQVQLLRTRNDGLAEQRPSRIGDNDFQREAEIRANALAINELLKAFF